MPYFDCDEGDLAGSDATTISRLFNAKSQVYDKSAYYYNMNSPSQETSFATMEDGYTSMEDGYTLEENEHAILTPSQHNNLKQDYNDENTINPKEEDT